MSDSYFFQTEQKKLITLAKTQKRVFRQRDPLGNICSYFKKQQNIRKKQNQKFIRNYLVGQFCQQNTIMMDKRVGITLLNTKKQQHYIQIFLIIICYYTYFVNITHFIRSKTFFCYYALNTLILTHKVIIKIIYHIIPLWMSEQKPETTPETKPQQKTEHKTEQSKTDLPILTPQEQDKTKLQKKKKQVKKQQKEKQKEKEKENSSKLPIKVVVLDNDKSHHFQFPPKLHNFNLTNSIFNLDDESQYKLNPRFNEIKHLEILREFLDKHNYDPTSIKIAKPLVSQRMKDNVDPITYQVLGKFQQDLNFEQAAKLLDLSQYLGISEFKEAMYAAIGSPFYIGESDEAIEQYRNKHGLTDLTVQQEDQIIKQFPVVFQKIQKELLQGVSKQIQSLSLQFQGGF